MGLNVKCKIVKNVYDVIQNSVNLPRSEELLRHFNFKKNDNKLIWAMNLRVKPDSVQLDKGHIEMSTNEIMGNWKSVKNVTYRILHNAINVDVEVESKNFIKDVLDSNPTNLTYKSLPLKNIFEFSSPNIAKPFHVGHLRSTMIGNCLANINQKLGNDVVRINYLGDWGTQIGLIQLGMQILNYSDEEFKKDPVKMLYQAYVRGNRDAERDGELYEKAKEIFLGLELEKEEIIKEWERYRSLTREEMAKMYNDLGVSFDEYSWESDYRRKNADKLLKALEEKGLLSEDQKGRKLAVVGERKMPLLKSDNTTLYLLRDLMAVVDRMSRYKFDGMYYVVENGQSDHFISLFTLCKELDIVKNVKLEHVKFGRIHGMSTRKGKVVFLQDVLEEAAERTYQKQINAKSTKIALDNRDVPRVLGISAVVVNDLKLNRKRDYNFSWEEILKMTATGIQLQYCHCRLCSLEANAEATISSECDPEAVLEPEAVDLVLQIARFEEVILQSETEMEPCVLVQYLFRLCKAINGALRNLRVKGEDSHVSGQRLLLFKKAQLVLAEGLKLLGLTPLTAM